LTHSLLGHLSATVSTTLPLGPVTSMHLPHTGLNTEGPGP
jgi:hypothetical protein